VFKNTNKTNDKQPDLILKFGKRTKKADEPQENTDDVPF
jgi:hypothetical protein